MTELQSKARRNAEAYFSPSQVEFFSKNHAYEEVYAANQARDEKTLRLRAARIAKEQADMALKVSPTTTKRKK
jgi:hypothetical protein